MRGWLATTQERRGNIMRHLLHFGLFVLALTAVTQADAQDRRLRDRQTTVVIATGSGSRLVRPVRASVEPQRAVYDSRRTDRTSSRLFESRNAGSRRRPTATWTHNRRWTVDSTRGSIVRFVNPLRSLTTTATRSKCALSATSLRCSSGAVIRGGATTDEAIKCAAIEGTDTMGTVATSVATVATTGRRLGFSTSSSSFPNGRCTAHGRASATRFRCRSPIAK